jgi:hypothetical protein
MLIVGPEAISWHAPNLFTPTPNAPPGDWRLLAVSLLKVKAKVKRLSVG